MSYFRSNPKKKSNKSSRKKRDGMIKDMLRNMGSGMSKTLRRSNKIPVFAAKAVRKRAVCRAVRAMKRLTRGFFR